MNNLILFFYTGSLLLLRFQFRFYVHFGRQDLCYLLDVEERVLFLLVLFRHHTGHQFFNLRQTHWFCHRGQEFSQHFALDKPIPVMVQLRKSLMQVELRILLELVVGEQVHKLVIRVEASSILVNLYHEFLRFLVSHVLAQQPQKVWEGVDRNLLTVRLVEMLEDRTYLSSLVFIYLLIGLLVCPERLVLSSHNSYN